MFEAWFSKRVAKLLPWYANGTLTATEREAVERWLRQFHEASAELAGWQRLRAAVIRQAQQVPSPAVRRQVIARARAQNIALQQARARSRLARVWGGALAAAILILLWTTVQPGIVLQWSVNDGPLTAFRVYRAPQGSTDFTLLYEAPAQPGIQQYTYVDAYLWPGQTYVYRVEGVGQVGRPALSQTLTANALEAFPGQLAVLFTSLIIGYGAVTLTQRWRWGGQASRNLRKPAT